MHWTSRLETLELTSRAITIRKHDLAIRLQTVESHPRPNVALEQYAVPADLAAEILFRACYEFGDIEGKLVIDLGTGTGRLSLGRLYAWCRVRCRGRTRSTGSRSCSRKLQTTGIGSGLGSRRYSDCARTSRHSRHESAVWHQTPARRYAVSSRPL